MLDAVRLNQLLAGLGLGHGHVAGVAPVLPADFACAGVGPDGAERCDVRMRLRNAICAACCKREAILERARYLARARAELADWDVVVPGTPEYKSRTVLCRSAVEYLSRWRREPTTDGEVSGNVVLLGPSGCGKTTVALGFARRILDRAARMDTPLDQYLFASGIRITTAVAIVNAEREYKLGGGRPPLLLRAEAASLLVIDEVGYIEANHAQHPLQTLIDLRNKRRGAVFTILTSGLTEDEFRRMYGASARKLIDKGHVLSMHQTGGGT